MQEPTKSKVGKNPPKKRIRNIITFEPCGPVRSMLAAEVKRYPNRTRNIERCIVQSLRDKYPKLAARYDVLIEEGQ